MSATKQFGKYRLIRQLGRGGMGAVYEAEDRVLLRRVALKILPAKLAADKASLQRFVREAQTAAKLGHPNVITIFDVDQHENYHYIAMELVHESAEALVVRGPLPWQEATRIAADASRGLAAAHQAGLVHRDVKPSNILLGADGRVRLADFGLAKPTDPEGTALTADRAVVGTPHYMSPEQCRGDSVTRLADVYSLGATYFTLLTGRVPYPRDEALQVMMAHCSVPPPDPRSLRPDLPSACARIVQRAMAKEPADRYPSADTLLAELEGALGQIASASVAAKVAGPASFDVVSAEIRSAASRNGTTFSATGDTVGPVLLNRRSARFAVLAGVGIVAIMIVLASVWSLLRDPGPAWTSLFNGKDMNGLFARPDSRYWSVENGCLVGTGDFSFLYTNRDDFDNFHCRVEMKLNHGANSGLCFRCVPDHGSPLGYEAQLGNGEFGGLYLYPRGLDAADKLVTRPFGVPADTWFTVEVIAHGTVFTVKINDTTVTEFVERRPTRPRGHLAIQSGSKDTVVTVRKFQVRELP